MRNRLLWAFGVSIGLLYSCSRDTEREILLAEFPANPWSTPRTAVDVFYENTDTIGLKSLKALVRFRNDFPEGFPFRFAIETLTPDSLIWRDTLTVPGDKTEITEIVSLAYTDVRTGYRSKTQFGKPGTYRFRFTPVTPDYEEQEIIGLGLEITSH